MVNIIGECSTGFYLIDDAMTVRVPNIDRLLNEARGAIW